MKKKPDIKPVNIRTRRDNRARLLLVYNAWSRTLDDKKVIAAYDKLYFAFINEKSNSLKKAWLFEEIKKFVLNNKKAK